MRELTLEGFLKEYTKDISLSNSLSVFKLEKEAKSNPRIVDIFSLLLILDENKRKYLQEKFPNSIYLNRVKVIENNITNHDLDNYFTSEEVDESLKKIYNSYLVEKNVKNKEFDRRKLYKNKIDKMRDNMVISDYKIYKTLNINSGNYNAFFKHNKLNKLSLQKVRDIYNFVDTY